MLFLDKQWFLDNWMDIFYLESAYPDYIEYQAHGGGGGSST